MGNFATPHKIASLVEKDRPICYGVLKPGDYCDQGVPLVRIVDLERNKIEEDRLFRISSALDRQFIRSKLNGGELLLSIQGTIGRVAITPQTLNGANISRTIARLAIKPEHSASFIRFVLLSEHGQRLVRDVVMGTTRDSLNIGALREIEIDLPLPVAQIKIAEILSTVDEAIEQTETLIAKYQQIKAGLMHDLFTRGVTPDGHLRPIRAQAPHLYKESALGWIPKEWEVRRLGVILKECGGYFQTGPFGSQLHAYEYQHEGVPVVMPQDINDGIVSTEQIARISERRGEELSRHRMKTGDIVIARRGDLSRASVITDREETWLCGTGCFLLRLGRSSLHGDFAALVYRHDVVQWQIAGMAVGTTMPSLNNNVMERVLFPYCDPDEQSRITERLDSLDQSLRFAQRHLANSTQIKYGLMHDLLTGRVRVKVGEPAST